MMFDGLRSRWTTPRACANSIARQTSTSAAQQPLGRLAAGLEQRRERRPGSRFIVKNGRPARVVAELVDRDDRGVIEPRLDPRLAQEPLDRARPTARPRASA